MPEITPTLEADAPRVLSEAGQEQASLAAGSSLVDMLRLAQARDGGLTPAAIEAVALNSRLPLTQVQGVATFYSMLGVAPATSPCQTARVCDGPVCWLLGAAQAKTALAERLGSGWRVERTSCLGLCDRAPAALLAERAVGGLPLDAAQALDEATPAGTYASPRPGEVRVMLARAGAVDPDALDSALALGAYRALANALTGPAERVLAEVEASGLQGRGGAGFPVGRKWRLVATAPAEQKYVVCNADESEPLIFKDRVLIDSDPHQLLEGMALAGYAVGASEAFIYIRGEYASQAARLERAVAQAEAHGCLGRHILGSSFSFFIHVHRGAGAYICGEETALLESLEGRRGEPRLRPPYPTTHGYRARPTLINNVETFSAVPAIVGRGAAWWRGLGAASTPGTKLYMVLGHVNRPGLFEAPFGLTLRQIIDDFGGGLRPGARFHFALTGGAAGTIVPASLLDVPIDFGSVARGVSLGAGSFLICDQTVSAVALSRELMRFFAVESCGQCTPCRVGTHTLQVILQRLSLGQGQLGDVAQLEQLCAQVKSLSLCGLGQSAPTALTGALQHFRDEFEAGIPAPGERAAIVAGD